MFLHAENNGGHILIVLEFCVLKRLGFSQNLCGNDLEQRSYIYVLLDLVRTISTVCLGVSIQRRKLFSRTILPDGASRLYGMFYFHSCRQSWRVVIFFPITFVLSSTQNKKFVETVSGVTDVRLDQLQNVIALNMVQQKEKRSKK